MARVSVKAFAPYTSVENLYAGELALGTHTKSNATLIEASGNQDQIVLHGTNLKYSNETLVSGRVTDVELIDKTGHIYATIRGADFKISDMESFDARSFVNAALSGRDKVTCGNTGEWLYSGAGNDVLIGGKGDDTLSGYFGNDRMTGGKGNDIFYASASIGNDIITDFDANGGEGAQDHIYTIDNHYTLQRIHSGKDTLVQFTNGDNTGSVILLGVKAAQITDDDFMFLY